MQHAVWSLWFALSIAVWVPGAARADRGWMRIGTARAAGTPKEFVAQGHADTCRIRCTDGTVTIQTVVTREGGRTTPFPVARQLQAGESIDVHLGQPRDLTGVRISDGGGGHYEVLLNSVVPTAAKPPRGWTPLADLTAGGDAKEVAVKRPLSVVRIQCIEGTVIIHTLVIREGKQHTPFPVTRRLNTGDHTDVDLGQARQATGLRISDGGRGRYSLLGR